MNKIPYLSGKMISKNDPSNDPDLRFIYTYLEVGKYFYCFSSAKM